MDDADAYYRFGIVNRASISEYVYFTDFGSVADARKELKLLSQQADRDFNFVLDPEFGIVGAVSFSRIRMDRFCSANLSYYLGREFRGRGYITTALGQFIPHGFVDLGLNRIEAFVHPHNEKSKRVLSRFGFQYEGLLRSYMKLNGAWHDHERWALLASDRSGANIPPRREPVAT